MQSIINTFVISGKKKHVVILDVDSKDLSAGMTCPPEAFIQEDFLKNVDLVLDSKGIFNILHCTAVLILTLSEFSMDNSIYTLNAVVI